MDGQSAGLHLGDQGGDRTGRHRHLTAATSSVGTALIQIAHDFGAAVIATTRTLARKPELMSLGADHAIATDDEDLAEKVASITDGRGAQVVCDTVGGPC